MGEWTGEGARDPGLLAEDGGFYLDISAGFLRVPSYATAAWGRSAYSARAGLKRQSTPALT